MEYISDDQVLLSTYLNLFIPLTMWSIPLLVVTLLSAVSAAPTSIVK